MTPEAIVERYSRRYERPHLVVEAAAALEQDLRGAGVLAGEPSRGPHGERIFPLRDGRLVAGRVDVPGLAISLRIQPTHNSR